MTDFSQKTAVITGAGGAIGGQIAFALARAGSNVAIWDISPEAAERRADEINQEAGGQALAVACDAVSKSSVAAALQSTMAQFGTVDFLINGAGGGDRHTTTSDDLSFFDIDPDQTRRVMDLNYLSAVIPSQAVGKLFAEKESGAIVNITSVGGGQPLSRALAYSNGKAAANSFTLWLAVHMAQTYSPKIRVNAIAPGIIRTRVLGMLGPENAEKYRERSLLKRLGEPTDIANTALFLCTDQGAYITGEILPVSGGIWPAL